MDKYEYKVRSEEIKELIARGDYVQAAELADTIDWRRVKSVMMLCTISDLYKINRRYEDARNMLLLAYERRPGGRTICYSLCELCIKTEEYVQAINYYKEFQQAAPKDPGRYILQYKLYEAQDVSLEERIGVLEELKKRDYREKWAYELAYLYHRVGLAARCVEECDELILWFGEGKYVIKAMELKMLHQPLTPEQQEKYNRRFEKSREPEEYLPEAGQEEGYEASEYSGEGQGCVPEGAYGEDQACVPEGAYGEVGQGYASEGAYGEGGYVPEGAYVEGGYVPEGAYGEDQGYASEGAYVEGGYAPEGAYVEGGYVPEGAYVEGGYVPEEAYGEANRFESGAGSAGEHNDNSPAGDEEELDIQVKTMDVGQYNTINLQAELAEGLKEILAEENVGKEKNSCGQEEQNPEDGGTSGEPAGETGQEEQSAGSGRDSEAEVLEDSEVFFGETGNLEQLEGVSLPAEGQADGSPEGDAAGKELGEAYAKESIAGTVPAGSAEEAAPQEKSAEDSDEGDTAKSVMEQMRKESAARGEEQVMTAQPPKELASVLSQEADGQISFLVPENEAMEKQITGQMNIEDILAEWERMKQEGAAKRAEEVRQRVLQHTGELFNEFEAAVRDGLLEQLENEKTPAAGRPGAAAGRPGGSLEAGEEELEYLEEISGSGAEENTEDISEENSGEPQEGTGEDFQEEEPEYTEESSEEDYEEEPEENPEDIGESSEESGEPLEEEPGEDFEEEVLEYMEEPFEEDYDEEPEESGETQEEPEEGFEEEVLEYMEESSGEDYEEDPEENPEDVGEPSEESGEAPSEAPADTEEGSGNTSAEGERRLSHKRKASKEEKTAKKAAGEAKEAADGTEKEKKQSADLANKDDSVEREKAKVRALTQEEKELFAPFIQNRSGREKLVKAIDSISLAAYTGNIIVTGEEGMDTITLAKNLIREVQITDSNFSGKVAKITGQGLSAQKVPETLKKVRSGALIIEKASGMEEGAIEALRQGLQQDSLGVIVLMEDTRRAMNKMLEAHPGLAESFTARMDLEPLSNDKLVAFGKHYAREMEYSIDDMGALALHTRIEERQTIDHVVTVMEVKQIVDEAIRHANRKNLGHFLDILFAKRYDEEDMIILTEKDFA